ncbi:MAG: hypothetical protein IKW90_03080 [Lachnospiraceae bacterium]|nr:hypothetical protein [Lachnospiraceae bacterium]
MKKNDLMLIFHNPDNYFFPFFKDIVYPPYEHREGTILYYIYRCMNICKLSISSFFWGSWKKQLRTVKQVIIFDYGYQNGMEKYIKKHNPSCEVYLFCWNKVSKVYNSIFNFTIKSNIYSTDIKDCKKYNLKFNHIFYPTELHSIWNESYRNNLYYLSSDKGRAYKVIEFKKILQQSGLTCNIKLFSDNKDPNYRKSISEILIPSVIPYNDYINEIKTYGILLDITQKGQAAFTFRVLESVIYSKKLITNNPLVKQTSFYNTNNILVFDINKLPTVDEIKAFVAKPFIPYTNEQLYEIGFEHWLSGFSSH